MSIWTAAIEALNDALAALVPDPEDEDFVPLVNGGVFNTPLARSGAAHPTLTAFSASGGMLTNIVIVDPDSFPHAQASEIPDAAEALLIIWYYANDDAASVANVDALREIVYPIFADSELELDDGRLAFPAWAGELATRSNHSEFKGSVIGNTRFRVTYQRR